MKQLITLRANNNAPVDAILYIDERLQKTDDYPRQPIYVNKEAGIAKFTQYAGRVEMYIPIDEDGKHQLISIRTDSIVELAELIIQHHLKEIEMPVDPDNDF